MIKKLVVVAAMTLLTAGCTVTGSGSDRSPSTGPASVAVQLSGPPVVGPAPSDRVAAFYYPWYGNPATDGRWIHWDEPSFSPPADISSDYYPQLGAYSSADPQVVAQHMAWLRAAGIGVIITSWWGRNTREDRVVPLLLQAAAQYGIKVAFHIEPYAGRSAPDLVADIQYLDQQYGSSPAFFRSTTISSYSPGHLPKPVFFVWCIEFAGDCGKQQPVTASYWRTAMDTIHALPEAPLIIANTLQTSWIRDGHFDGLYNYITLHLNQNGGFGWARSLPPGSLYVPSVMPGNSAQRVGYPPDTLVPRQDGGTYNAQWSAALGTGVQPALVTVTSFNEWHEGSMIEPPAAGATNGNGYSYATFGALPPDGYLTLTRKWVDQFEATTWPPTYRARIRIRTSSDWTNVDVVSGAQVLAPDPVAANPGASVLAVGTGTRFTINQPLAKATSGKFVEVTYDVVLTGVAAGKPVTLAIERGNLGTTQVTVYNYVTATPVPISTISWAGVTGGTNHHQVQVNSGLLTTSTP